MRDQSVNMPRPRAARSLHRRASLRRRRSAAGDAAHWLRKGFVGAVRVGNGPSRYDLDQVAAITSSTRAPM